MPKANPADEGGAGAAAADGFETSSVPHAPPNAKPLPPFAPAPRELLYDQRVKPLALRVYLVLADHATKAKATCFLKHSTIADKLNVDRRSVQRSLDELREAGWISWEPHRNSRRVRRGKPENIYTIHRENKAALVSHSNAALVSSLNATPVSQQEAVPPEAVLKARPPVGTHGFAVVKDKTRFRERNAQARSPGDGKKSGTSKTDDQATLERGSEKQSGKKPKAAPPKKSTPAAKARQAKERSTRYTQCLKRLAAVLSNVDDVEPGDDQRRAAAVLKQFKVKGNLPAAFEQRLAEVEPRAGNGEFDSIGEVIRALGGEGAAELAIRRVDVSGELAGIAGGDVTPDDVDLFRRCAPDDEWLADESAVDHARAFFGRAAKLHSWSPTKTREWLREFADNPRADGRAAGGFGLENLHCQLTDGADLGAEIQTAGATLVEQSRAGLQAHTVNAPQRLVAAKRPRDQRSQKEITGAALMVLSDHPEWTTVQVAEAIRTSPKRLTPKAAPELTRLRQALVQHRASGSRGKPESL